MPWPWSRQLYVSAPTRKAPHRQDGPWAWLVVATATLQMCLASGVTRMFPVILPVLMAEFNESRQSIALVSSLQTGISLLLSAPASWLCVRYGEHVISAFGHVICIVSLLLTTLQYDVTALYFTYSVTMAIGSSSVYTAGLLISFKYFNKQRSLALGIFTAGSGIGVMTIPVLSQYLISIVGWRNTYRVFTGFYSTMLFLSSVYDPNVEQPHRAEEKACRSEEQDNAKAMNLKNMFDLSLWRIPKFAVGALSVAIGTFGLYNAYVHLVKYSEEIGMTAKRASMLYIFLGLTSIVSRIIAGRLSDIPRVNPNYLNMGSQALCAICVILLTKATTYTHLVVFSLFYGVAEGVFRTSMNVLLASSVPPSKASSAFGMGIAFTSLFHTSGATIAGLMADRSGSYLSAFYMSGGVLLFAAAIHLVSLCFRRPPEGLGPTAVFVEEQTRSDMPCAIATEAQDNLAMEADKTEITRL